MKLKPFTFPLSTLLGMRVRTKRFLKPRRQFKCSGVTTANVDYMLKPFATPSVQHRSTKSPGQWMLEPFNLLGLLPLRFTAFFSFVCNRGFGGILVLWLSERCPATYRDLLHQVDQIFTGT